MDKLNQIQEGKNDYKRSLTFITFGFIQALYFSPFYINIYPKLVQKGLKPILLTVFDTVVQSPFVFMPLFYFTQQFAMNDYSLPCRKKVWKTWKDNLIDDTKNLIYVFGPLTLSSFYLVPPNYRPLFLITFGSIYPWVLSHTRGNYKKNES
jgi:hypothetical protein